MEINFKNFSYKQDSGTSREKKFFDKINLTIKNNSVVAFLNDNIEVLNMFFSLSKRPSSGEIKFDDIVFNRTSHIDNIELLKNRIGIIDSEKVFYSNKTIKNVIEEYMNANGYVTKNKKKHIIGSLKIVGMSEEYLERDPNELSFNEQMMLKLACVMSYNPEVIVLNDFTKRFIFRERDYFRKLFLKLKNQFNKTIILIGNDTEFLFEIVDNFYVINNAKLVFEGDKNSFYDEKLYKYIELPKIVEFTKYAQTLGHEILQYTDTKELLKELYRVIK